MNKAVERNLEKSAERLDATRLLLEHEKFEDSINRAYYSIYYSAKALLLLKDISPKTHKGLIGKFGKEFIKTGEINPKFSTMLSEAESLRESADYGIMTEIEPEEAEKILGYAEDFLEMAREYTSD